ncbi:hypothetical protein O3M35_008952 [Rhynocoris fuscipes]|uniref:Uncharacterized protein n=1 Tax=Rhynocoris fuscipes TaxID=488301 RepID=A0AAW1D242_9HEMI
MEVGHFAPDTAVLMRDNAWEFESVVGGGGLRRGGAQVEEAGARCSAWQVDVVGGLVRAGVLEEKKSDNCPF